MIEVNHTPGQILIAEPDETGLLAITGFLREEGYPCTPARDGFGAIRELRATGYDLLIAEIHMPGNAEFELVEAAHRYAPGMPVILYTRYPSLASAIAAVQLSVSAYLVKPVENQVLLRQVKKSIAGYRSMKRTEALLKELAVFAWAIEDAIRVLDSTRGSFKSNELAALRRKLERILAGEHPE